MGGRLSGLEKIVMKLHANWGHAWTQQLKRVLAGSGGEHVHLITRDDEVLDQCELCRAFDKAPRAPIAGALAASMFYEKLRAGLLFLADLIALDAMDAFPEYSFLKPVRLKNPREVWGAFRNSRIGVFGPLQGIQTDEGIREWGNEVWTELRP